MNHTAILQHLRSFLNDDMRYRKFLRICNGSGRERGVLVFWQQRVWDALVEQQPPLREISIAELLDACRVCHVHLKPLQDIKVPIRKGVVCMLFSPEHENWIAEHAPYSTCWVLDSTAWGSNTHVSVARCDQCLADYIARFGTKP